MASEPKARPFRRDVHRPLDIPLAGYAAREEFGGTNGHRAWIKSFDEGFPRPYARLTQNADGALLAPFTVALPSHGGHDAVGLALSFSGPAAARTLAAALIAICDEIGDDAPDDLPF